MSNENIKIKWINDQQVMLTLSGKEQKDEVIKLMLNDSNYIKSCERISSSIKGRNTSAGIELFLYVKDDLMKEEYQEKMNNWVG